MCILAHTAHPPLRVSLLGCVLCSSFEAPLSSACRKEIRDDIFERTKKIRMDLPMAPWHTQPTLPLECHC